MKWFI